MQNKQSKAARAKLFQPFDSLKGFKDYLRMKERVVVEPIDLSEDDLELLNYKMQQVSKGMVITVVYYDKGEYVELEGKVVNIDADINKTIQIVEKVISFKSIVQINF